MLVNLTLGLMVLAAADGPVLNERQIMDLIQEKQAPAKSFAFVYEGFMRWLGDPSQKDEVRWFEEQFQGTFFYRDKLTAFYDVYLHRTARTGGVVRQKCAVLDGRQELLTNLLDAKQRVRRSDVQRSNGDAYYLDPEAAPIDLFLVWNLKFAADLIEHEVSSEGWEVIDGRNCLRVRVETFSSPDGRDKGSNTRLFWFDLDRNAQALKEEYHQHGKLAGRIDNIQLVEMLLGDQGSYWFPISSRRQIFRHGAGGYSAKPYYERVNKVVAGSVKLNIDLPDSMFTVTKELTWPASAKLDETKRAADSGTLIRQFREQPPQPPVSPTATDPVSVRRRVEERLREADHQAAEIQASSPARRLGGWSDLGPVAVGVLGVVILAWVAVVKWRRG